MKKQSQVSKVAELFKTNPTMSARDMATVLGLDVKKVYVLRNMAKKKAKKKTVSKVTNENPIRLRIGQMPLYHENLQKENLQLTEWTQMWKRKYEQLDADYTQAKIMYLDSQAVIKYLEAKVAQLLKGD